MKKKQIGYDTIKLTASKVFAVLVSLVATMLLSRFRTLEEYGTYSQMLTAINLITAFFMLGLPNSINYFLGKAKSEDDKQKFINLYYTLSTILGIISGLVLLLSTPLIAKYYDNNLIKNFWYFLVFYPWAKVIMASIEYVLISYERTNLIMGYRIFNGIALVGTILGVQLAGLGFTSYMIAFVVVEAIFAISVYVIVKNTAGKLSFSLNKNLLKTVLAFSIPIGLASIVGTINIELDKLLIGRLFSTEQLAIYTNASKELPLTIIAASFTAILMPHIVKLLDNKENEAAVKLWGNAITLSFALISFLVAGIFVFAPDVVEFLYGEKYLPGINVFRIYAILALFKFTYFGLVLNAVGKTKIIFYSSLITMLLNIILNYVLYLIFDFEGPAVATVISQVTMQAVQLIFTSKIIGVSLKRIFPWKSLGIITLTNAIMALGFYFLKKVIPLDNYMSSLLESIILAVVWGGLYILVMYKPLKKNWLELNMSDEK